MRLGRPLRIAGAPRPPAAFLLSRHIFLPDRMPLSKKSAQPCPLSQQLSFRCRQNSRGAGWLAPYEGGIFMADDMEKKDQFGQGQQGGKSGQKGQGDKYGQGSQQSGRPGQQQPKKGGPGENDNEEDQNRDRQRRSS